MLDARFWDVNLTLLYIVCVSSEGARELVQLLFFVTSTKIS